MHNPFNPYFTKLIQERKVTQDEEKIIRYINTLFSKRIPNEIVTLLNGLAFLVEFIHFEQTADLIHRKLEDEDKS